MSSETSEYQPRSSGVGKKLIGLLVILILLAALIGYGIYYYNKALQPKDSGSTENEQITIEDGMLTSEVAQLLEDEGIITNALIFQSYVGRHSYGGAEIQAAVYELSPSMSVPQIYSKLINGEAYHGTISQIVIPEGKNINEIAQIVQDAGICTADEYLAEVQNIDKYKANFTILDSIPDEEIPERTLEGYLFPDTYEIAKEEGSPAEDLVFNQLTRFSDEYNSDLINQTHAEGKTVDDIVTLASIVELESKFPDDRPLVASVFYNRMANDMPLQSDITIDYINGTKTPVLTTEQTQVDSPYNTYINLGLPLGPICNPGISSIEACINTPQTNYLYFVADMDTGELHFNESLDEHNEDVSNYIE